MQALLRQHLCTHCRTRSPSSWRPLTKSLQVGHHCQLACRCSCAVYARSKTKRLSLAASFVQSSETHILWCLSLAGLLHLLRLLKQGG